MSNKYRKKVSKIKIKIKAIKRKIGLLKRNLNINSIIKGNFNHLLKRYKRWKLKYQNCKNRVYYIFTSRIAIVFLFMILMIKTILFYVCIHISEDEFWYTCFISFIYMLILLFPIFFIRKGKNRFRAVIGYDMFFSLLLFADNVYWEYSANMLSVSQIFYVKYAEEISATFPYLLKFFHILYFIDIPIILGAFYISNRKVKSNKESIRRNREKRKINLALGYILCVFIIRSIVFAKVY